MTNRPVAEPTTMRTNGGLNLAGMHSGAVVIVTGAAGGIGAAIVDAFLQADAHVIATDIAEPTEIGGAQFLEADLSTAAGAGRVADLALGQHGRIDVLVNNAGGGVIRPFLEHDEESMHATIDRNLWTTVHCCRAVLPAMVEQSYGRIVNIGAESVRNGLWEHAMYNGAKGGVHGLTTGLAREFGRAGITVNTVAPSGVNTPRIVAGKRLGSPDLAERAGALSVTGGRVSTEELASMVCYLALPLNQHITGQVISINGGSSML